MPPTASSTGRSSARTHPNSWRLLISTAPLLLIGSRPIVDQDWSGLSLHIWIGPLFVMNFAVYVAYQLWNYAISTRGAAVASSYGLLVPILSAIMAATFFEEKITALQSLGAAMAVAGLLLVRPPRGWRPPLLGNARRRGSLSPSSAAEGDRERWLGS